MASCAAASTAPAASGGAAVSPKSTARAAAKPPSPLTLRGMWIWYVSASNGGNVSSIAAKAHAYGVNTLIIKAGDGSSPWSQFNSGLVSALHARGLRVCAWQYVYGNYPVTEAQVGANAVRAGADCLVIDAEIEYEGKYLSAQSYISALRARIGSSFPVGLAGFPYVDYHPAFPYSVFLGPGGAQYNVPQMYWVDIGTTVSNVYAHTYSDNSLYRRTIAPLGQLYNQPAYGDILRFRQYARAYHAPNASWWDWQEAGPSQWQALAQPEASLRGSIPAPPPPVLSTGSQGDLVVWAQEHLLSAGDGVSVDGSFGPLTQNAVKRFQQAHRLSVDGVIGPQTWSALLRYAPAKVIWHTANARAAKAMAHRVGASTFVAPVPPSALLPAKHYEIPPHLGAH